MKRKPCASCGPSSAEGWMKAEGGSANWLQEEDVVRNFFAAEEPPGFFVNVTVPSGAKFLWTSAPLTLRYKAPPSAREAYTSETNGRAIQCVFGVSNLKEGSTLRIRAPVPYRDAPPPGSGGPGTVYPPHAHAIDASKRVFTLPYLVPECDLRTAMAIASRLDRWKVIYVLDNLASYSAPPLPRTCVIQTASEIARRITADTPILVYCAKRTCNASHRVASELLKHFGFQLVARYPGGMEELAATKL